MCIQDFQDTIVPSYFFYKHDLGIKVNTVGKEILNTLQYNCIKHNKLIGSV